jgi:hypothetical protein
MRLKPNIKVVFIRAFIFIYALFSFVNKTNAQVDVELPHNKITYFDFDSNFITTYRYHVTTRLYTSQKYTFFTLPTLENKPILFRPNSTLNLGLGWTHRGFTLNIGVPVPLLNGDFSQRGKTSKLDLQMHIYARKSVVDVFLQRYQGYYNNEGLIEGTNGFYNDENIKVRKAGISYLRVHNYRKYSLRTSAQHDEVQLQSAGSVLYGFDVLFGLIKNDYSSIVNINVIELSRYRDVQKITNFNVGPTLGYGYNQVIARRFIVGAAVTGTIALSHYQENNGATTQGKDDISFYRGGNFGLAPQASFRGVVAYNTDRWGVFAYIVNHTVTAPTHTKDYMSLSTGNYRLNFVFRFIPPSQVKKILKPYEWFLK